MRSTMMAGTVAVLALLAGCGSATAHASGGKPAAPVHVIRGCVGHPGARLGSYAASACMWQVRGNDGGTLYWSRYPDAYQYYWQPTSGDMLVTETYYLPNGPFGMPIAWDGRLVSLGDGCVATETGPPKSRPTSCVVDQEEGRFRGMTPAEQQSVADFWSVMRGFPARQW